MTSEVLSILLFIYTIFPTHFRWEHFSKISSLFLRREKEREIEKKREKRRKKEKDREANKFMSLKRFFCTLVIAMVWGIIFIIIVIIIID